MTKILLVEDDGQIAAYLGELLRAEGFDTQIAGLQKYLSNFPYFTGFLAHSLVK